MWAAELGLERSLLISICSGDDLVARRFGASGCAPVADGYEVMCSSSCRKMRVSDEYSHVVFHGMVCSVVYVAMVTASAVMR
jgi:hypothetical protein